MFLFLERSLAISLAGSIASHSFSLSSWLSLMTNPSFPIQLPATLHI